MRRQCSTRWVLVHHSRVASPPALALVALQACWHLLEVALLCWGKLPAAASLLCARDAAATVADSMHRLLPWFRVGLNP